MTLSDRIEELRERLLHSHQADVHADRRHERESEGHDDHHHIDLSTGSEYLDVK